MLIESDLSSVVGSVSDMFAMNSSRFITSVSSARSSSTSVGFVNESFRPVMYNVRGSTD